VDLHDGYTTGHDKDVWLWFYRVELKRNNHNVMGTVNRKKKGIRASGCLYQAKRKAA